MTDLGVTPETEAIASLLSGCTAAAVWYVAGYPTIGAVGLVVIGVLTILASDEGHD